jgi:hypothetical protein
LKKPSIYFENFTLRSFLIGLLKNEDIRGVFSGLNTYYFDSSFIAKKLLIPLLIRCNILVKKIHFNMIDIKDEKGELVRLRIPRKDLFVIQDKIINSEAFNSFSNETWKQNSFLDFILKGVIDGSITEERSVNRVLYLVSVVDWHMKKNKFSQSIFVINNRPWFNIYSEYASAKKIKLNSVKVFSLYPKKQYLKNFIRNHIKLYVLIKNLKYSLSLFIRKTKLSSKNLVYIDGRGDISLENNGNNTDFFWFLNSKFPIENIIYKHLTNSEKDYFIQHGLSSFSEGMSLVNIHKRNYIKPRIHYDSRYKDEFQLLKSLKSSYDLDRMYWGSFFKNNGVKIYTTWEKFNISHIALSDAVNDNNGLSVISQLAFEGTVLISYFTNIDIYFCFSSYSYEIAKKANSNIKYTVITGYLKDYVPSLVIDKAKDVRKKLQANGAERIIFAIDENSLDDSRWHTGHELQRENYSYILEKVLEIPWLGVIFKPKKAVTLRRRLGPAVADLLEEVEATGRCYIYEESGRYTTSAPPILAGLSADICIHGHLAAGSAAIECAFEGLPTLLIDREGSPSSKLYDLPEGKVIFKDWPSAINASLEYFNKPESIPGFGDWTSILDEFDPFRDGMAAYRMGTYLKWLIDGYENGLEREEIMENAAERYKKKWGEDKVITT